MDNGVLRYRQGQHQNSDQQDQRHLLCRNLLKNRSKNKWIGLSTDFKAEWWNW
jgi:hypothetical protein